MRKLVLLAAAAALIATTPSMAQAVRLEIPASAAQWVDNPLLAPAVTDRETRARMNAEIVEAIHRADGDQDAARFAVLAIVARYQDAASAQGARTRPSPK